MDTFRMADIIPLLPLPYPPQGRASYYVPCPRCDRGGGKHDKHLNINMAKDVFRCPKCGWNGGVFDLYAQYTGAPREGIREELKRAVKGYTPGQPLMGRSIPTPVPKAPPEALLADIDTRHATYSALLSVLPLAPDHRANLLDRGLPENIICKNEYRTTPVVGQRALAKKLLDTGHTLKGVPGFYRCQTGDWTFAATQRGILVPVRDLQGRIQGIQIRRDNADKRKCRWVSSADIDGGLDGCGAEGWVHLSGPVRERIFLTEGPMKADVIHQLTGQSVIAVPGVNTLKHLERTLNTLIGLGVTQVMTAFDMDFLKNHNVKNGYAELTDLLGGLDLRFGTYLWHPEYNGLDDYIWEFCLGHRRAS